MHVRLSVWGEPGRHLLTSLQNWLKLEPGLRRATLTREPGDQPEDRPDDHLIIVLPADQNPKVLAGALSTWLSTRIGDVRLKVDGPDGTAQVSVCDIADHEVLLRAALGEQARSSPPVPEGAESRIQPS